MHFLFLLLMPLFAQIRHVIPSAPKAGEDPTMSQQPKESLPGFASPQSLPEDQKAFYKDLPPEKQNDFLKLGDTERDQLVKSKKKEESKKSQKADQNMEAYLKKENANESGNSSSQERGQ